MTLGWWMAVPRERWQLRCPVTSIGAWHVLTDRYSICSSNAWMRTMTTLYPRSAHCRTQNRSLFVLEHFNTRDQRTEKFPSPLYLPPPPSHTGPSILSMAISERDPHNPTDVEVLDLYYPLTKTSDLVVFDLPSELPLSI
ncbi:hypothetical protein PO909_020495 [Leuciscus waleckii]